MAKPGSQSGRSGGSAGSYGRLGSGVAGAGVARKKIPFALPADLGRALRHLGDADFDRLLESVTAEARRRGRQDSRTVGSKTRQPAAWVTPGQERLVHAAFEAGLRPAAIAREFRVSRTRVEAVVAAAKTERRRMVCRLEVLAEQQAPREPASPPSSLARREPGAAAARPRRFRVNLDGDRDGGRMNGVARVVVVGIPS